MSDDTNDTPGRSRRVRADKSGRSAALEKLKLLKGNKHKYEVVEEAPVYEELDEKSYSKLVQQRQEEDWIVDDDGAGYIEDGREIFDDDNDAGYTDKKKSNASKKKYEPPEKRNVSKKSDIKSMFFKAQSTKRKNEDVKLDDDELLGSIMEDIHNSSAIPDTPRPMISYKKPKRSIGSSGHKFSVNPFKNRQLDSVTPPAEFRPKQSMMQNQIRKDTVPKTVNFDDALDAREISPVRENGNVVEALPDSGVDLESEFKSQELDMDDMEFENFSTELFNSQENQLEKEVPIAVESKSGYADEVNISKDLFESSFQGNIDGVDKTSSAPVISVDPGCLPLIKLKNGQSVLRFFWFDAFEDQYKFPGVVYLFGKVFLKSIETYVSCCVIVKDIQRRVYVLPRETHFDMKTNSGTEKPVTLQDVYSEISSIATKMKISEFKTKKTLKCYAFGNTAIPHESEYLEVQYSSKFPPFPSNCSGATFSHILGTDTTSLEILLLDQKLKGPGWIDIHCPQPSNPPVSWCKVEAVVTRIQHVTPAEDIAPPPPLVVLTFYLTSVINSKSQQNEIAALSCLIHNKFPLDKAAPKPHFEVHFCALTKPTDCIFPYDFKDAALRYKGTKIEQFDSERALLAFFLAKFHKIDPDVIVSHDVVGFSLDVLLHRISFHKIPNWSRIGRLKRAGVPRFSNAGFSERNVTCGRLLCDIKISAKELIRCRSYDLPELANQILDCKFEELQPEFIHSYYNSSKQLIHLVDNAMIAADLTLRINCELNILPLALQITNVAGCVMSRTLLGGRSERNEFLLLHAFHEKNYICPPKFSGKKKVANDEGNEMGTDQKQSRRKPAYEGGLVLEPKKGFYDRFILVMDFNSLYPSIIQEYNICFTTVEILNENSPEAEDQIQLPEPGSEPGVLPTEIRKLVESRRQVKQMMKTPDLPKDKLIQYDIRQRALKLTANSMYGCLGFSHSRFFAKVLAALITKKGREILMKAKDLVEKMGLDVIYGDTDSIMINTNQIDFDEVMKLGNRVKAEINKLYRLLEIDIDGVYKPMLLLKKKKYAALSVTRLPNGQLKTKEELKGLDVVRRDWSQLAKSAGEYVIKQILSDKSREEILENIHSHLINLGEDIRSEKKPISDFIIVKQLNKNPEDYPDKKSLPHVAVALRMNSKLGKKIKQNDTVPYIICTDGTDSPTTQRAYHPDELRAAENLKIDTGYYLSNQIHPVISRLCSPIEGTDASMIAKLLGLNPEKYVTSHYEAQEDDNMFSSTTSIFDDEDRFKECDQLVFCCPADDCNEFLPVDDVFKPEVTPYSFQLSSCSKCNAKLIEHWPALCNQLQRAIRKYIQRYYQRVLICEDVGCAHKTRKMPLIFSSGGPLCSVCRKSNLRLEYTEAQLYLQLSYFRHLFDIEKAKKRLSVGKGEKDKLCIRNGEDVLYAHLKNAADRFLQISNYGQVNLSELFQGLFLQAPPAS